MQGEKVYPRFWVWSAYVRIDILSTPLHIVPFWEQHSVWCISRLHPSGDSAFPTLAINLWHLCNFYCFYRFFSYNKMRKSPLLGIMVFENTGILNIVMITEWVWKLDVLQLTDHHVTGFYGHSKAIGWEDGTPSPADVRATWRPTPQSPGARTCRPDPVIPASWAFSYPTGNRLELHPTILRGKAAHTPLQITWPPSWNRAL